MSKVLGDPRGPPRDYGRYITADLLQQIYYGKYITADILQQIYYGRYIKADTLWQIYCVQQKRPCLDKFLAPEALDCCIRICLLQRITLVSPGTSQTALRTPLGCTQVTYQAILSCILRIRKVFGAPRIPQKTSQGTPMHPLGIHQGSPSQNHSR